MIIISVCSVGDIISSDVVVSVTMAVDIWLSPSVWSSFEKGVVKSDGFDVVCCTTVTGRKTVESGVDVSPVKLPKSAVDDVESILAGLLVFISVDVVNTEEASIVD